ncbi:putative baseplate assembly protein [Bradyrhizobium sp.]|uniref:putative baseplate assembly protein n=1 Tax=Bradyrhizobium sp. TaxID=376 RepID=UPI003C238ED5
MATQYFCKSKQRRQLLLAQAAPGLNGIDFLEVDPGQLVLHIHFLFDLPGTPNPVPPAPAPGLTANNIIIEGGERITGINVVPNSLVVALNVLTLTVSAAGDFSTYTLRLAASPTDQDPPSGFDPVFSSVAFSFKANCPSDFDCAPITTCPPQPVTPLNINYLAKDYGSFRQLMFDRMAVTTPGWQERNPADLGVALVELLAYAGDQLSYYQDAVATEAYLGTARRRISVRRHARLLDYSMHDGCNARCFAFLDIAGGASVLAPKGTQLLTGVVATPQTPPPGVVPQSQMQALVNQGALAFRTLADLTAHDALNQISFFTWSDSQCCLPRGATAATLEDLPTGDLPLSAGDLLLFEEIKGTATGLAADANPAHRHVVRLLGAPLHKTDPLTSQKLVEIAWDPADALPFPLCLSIAAITPGSPPIADVSVARGNLVLAEQALRQPQETLPGASGSGPYRPRLNNPNVSIAVAYDDAAARKLPVAGLLIQDPTKAVPQVSLSGSAGNWSPQRDLLESSPTALDFVVETDDNGIAVLRFGDGSLGAAPPPSGLVATYSTGNGAAGNIGADALAYIISTPTAPLAGVAQLRNPLPAQGGVDPESLDETRNFAPQAFRIQQRAVTAADYAEVAQRHPQVQKAQATLRWTGSWHTMFVTVERTAGQAVNDLFRTQIRNYLEQFRLAGYDLEIEAPSFVSLDIAFTVCIGAGYFRSDIQTALAQTFSNRLLPGNRTGFFYPGNFTFGQRVYISQIVAAAMQTPGVMWVDTNDVGASPNHFTRLGQKPNGEAAAGLIAMAPLEIARLDNDPSRPENGKIQFILKGGL